MLGAYICTLINDYSFFILYSIFTIVLITRPLFISIQCNVNRASKGEKIKYKDLFVYYSISFKKPMRNANIIFSPLVSLVLLSYLIIVSIDSIYLLLIEHGNLSFTDFIKAINILHNEVIYIYYFIFGMGLLLSIIIVYHNIGISYIMLQYRVSYPVAKLIQEKARKKICLKYKHKYFLSLTKYALLFISIYCLSIIYFSMLNIPFIFLLVLSSSFPWLILYPMVGKIFMYENNMVVLFNKEYELHYLCIVNESLKNYAKKKK